MTVAACHNWLTLRHGYAVVAGRNYSTGHTLYAIDPLRYRELREEFDRDCAHDG